MTTSIVSVRRYFSLFMLLTLGACGDDSSGSTPGNGCATRSELTDDMFVGGETLPTGTCWLVAENLSLDDGTFTVEEGVSVWFETGVSVVVETGGQLRIAGTDEAPVELTTADPLVTWKGVHFRDSQGSDNDWAFVLLENAGDANWTGASDSAAALYLTGTTTLSMDNVTLARSQASGLTVGEDVSFSFSNGAFVENNVPAHVHPNVFASIGSETTFSGNTNEHVRVVFGNTDAVNADQVWPALQAPIQIQNRFFVNSALSIEAGATLEFVQDAGMIVRDTGSLSAEGTAEAPITFRASSAGTKGFWKGIQIEAGGTTEPVSYGATFEHAIVEDAGSERWTGAADTESAVYLSPGSAALVTNTTFRNNAGYALIAGADTRIDGFSNNAFEGNQRTMHLYPDRVGELAETSTFENNDEQFIAVVFGNTDRVSVPASWRPEPVPFRINNRLFVEAALSIESGVTLEFAQNVRMIIDQAGSLTVNGTAAMPVRFVGATDTTGFWTGVQFESNDPKNTLTFANFANGGAEPWTGASDSVGTLYVNADAQLTLNDVTIDTGGENGVTLASDTSVLSCTDVTLSGGGGAYIVGGGAPTCS